jgi:hypothetical protein
VAVVHVAVMRVAGAFASGGKSTCLLGRCDVGFASLGCKNGYYETHIPNLATKSLTFSQASALSAFSARIEAKPGLAPYTTV